MKLALCLLTLTLATPSAGADDRVKMYLSVGAAMAPANVYIQTILERSQNNRSIRVVAESDLFYSSSTISLDGEHAPRINTVRLAQLPAGLYIASVSVTGVGGRELAHTRQYFEIR
jgi:hypothetical protein